jgi:hypothetical protein
LFPNGIKAPVQYGPRIAAGIAPLNVEKRDAALLALSR